MTNFGFVHTVYLHCLWPTFNLIGSAYLPIGFSSGLFNLKSSCRCLPADVVAFHQDLLLQTQCCSSRKSCPPDSVNQPLLQCPLHAPHLLRSPLSIAAPNAFHRSASAVHRDWPDLRPTLWGSMMHYLLDCSRYWLQAFSLRVFTHTSAEFWFLSSSFLDTLPN